MSHSFLKGAGLILLAGLLLILQHLSYAHAHPAPDEAPPHFASIHHGAHIHDHGSHETPDAPDEHVCGVCIVASTEDDAYAEHPDESGETAPGDLLPSVPCNCLDDPPSAHAGHLGARPFETNRTDRRSARAPPVVANI